MPVRIGLIGSGFVSNFYMLGLKDLSGWEVPVVASPTADHSRRFAEKWEIAESTTDVLGVIRRDDIDLVLLDMGCHTIEAARYFVGKENPVVEVIAWGDRLYHHDKTEAEDNAVLLMRFEGGELGQAELSWTARGGLDLRNEVYGTEGVIFTDVTRETPIKVFSRPGAGYIVEKAEAETGWLFPPVDEAWIYGYREEMRHFIECVKTGAMPRETFEDGYVVNCILDAAYQSMQTKKWEQ